MAINRSEMKSTQMLSARASSSMINYLALIPGDLIALGPGTGSSQIANLHGWKESDPSFMGF